MRAKCPPVNKEREEKTKTELVTVAAWLNSSLFLPKACRNLVNSKNKSCSTQWDHQILFKDQHQILTGFEDLEFWKQVQWNWYWIQFQSFENSFDQATLGNYLDAKQWSYITINCTLAKSKSHTNSWNKSCSSFIYENSFINSPKIDLDNSLSGT
jgi:hypothetical protein